MIKVLENISDFPKIIEENKNVLVDFNAKWCSPCRMMGRIIESIDEDYKDVVFLKVDTDEFPEIAQKFGVISIPSMFAFQNGKRIYVKVDGKDEELLLGALVEEQFRELINKTFSLN